MAVFDLTGSDVTRAWDIKVTQYKCGDEMGGKHITQKYDERPVFNFILGLESSLTKLALFVRNYNYPECCPVINDSNVGLT